MTKKNNAGVVVGFKSVTKDLESGKSGRVAIELTIREEKTI
jgi:hypothetical protein